MNKKIAFFTLFLIGTVVIIIASKNNEKRTPVESPKYRSISKTNFYLGKFKPIEMVKIQPKISGIVDSVYVEIGDKVNIDDKIAKLRIIPIPEEMERSKKSLRLASVNLKQKKVDHNRNITLFKKDVIAKKELEKTALELNFAKIEYANAQNNFNIAKKGFSNNANESPNIVRSTINGEVLNILVKKGVNVTERNTFNDGSTIAILVNTNSFIYEFEVTETDISNVKKGDNFSIAIKALNNKVVKAQIKELKPLIKEDNNFYYIASAILLDTIPNIKPGYTGLGEFILQQKKEALSIKEKNIIYKNRKSFVELIDEDENISEIEIKTGVSDGIYTEILSGIKKNDKIKLQ
jgi:HlyD family secretion protein